MFYKFVSVRIRGCRNNRFKGFFIQPRLAQYPNVAVFLGAFGRVGGAQYTCHQNGGILTHIDPSLKESVTFIWMAPPRPVGHIIFRVTFVQSYTTFWVGVNSPVVYDGVSTELRMIESVSLQTPTDAVCLPPALMSASMPIPTNNNKLQPAIVRPIMEPKTTTKTMKTTTAETKSTSEPTPTTIRSSTSTSRITYVTTIPTTSMAASSTAKRITNTISTPATASITSDKPTLIKYTPNTTTALIPTASSTTASTQQNMVAMITRITAAPIISTTSQATQASVTPTRRIITKTTELLTSKIVQIPTTETNKIRKVLTTTRKTSLEHIQTSQIISKNTVKYLNTTPSTFNQTGVISVSPNIRCGSLLGCFDDCEGEICSFVVAWQHLGTHVQFEVKKKTEGTADHWVAIGFSDDRMMGVDSVIECISESGVVKVYQSYNLENYRNVRLAEPSVVLSNELGSLQDGIFSCSFTRENNPKNEKEIFDLQNDWYLIFANGRAIHGTKLPHEFTVLPAVSEIKVDFQSYPPMHLKHSATTITADQTKSNGPSTQQIYITRDPECGIRTSCFQNCNALDCEFVVTWTRRDDHVIFKMRAVTSEQTNQWIAIAFSDDDKMGEDSVMQCVSDEGNIIRVKQSYNKGRNNFEIASATKGIYNVTASFVDGILSCEFTRDRIIHDEPEIFNLDRKWKLLFAQGKSKRGTILPHALTRMPQASEDWVDFSHDEANLISAPIIYIKVHSCLMIFTWCFAASISVILGRYFQPVCRGDKVFGSKSWSKVHRLFVVTTVLGFITGLIVMFVGVQGISTVLKHDTSSLKRSHPVLGLLVTFLALLCPILLIFRPLEGTASRSVFNWIVWLVESITWILAVVTMFAGLKLSEVFITSDLEYLILGYAAYQVLTTMLLESIRCYDVHKDNEKKIEYLYNLYLKPWSMTSQNSWTSALDIHESRKGVKKVILGINVMILSVFVFSSIIIIVRS